MLSEQNAARQRYVPFNSKHKRSAAASHLTRLPPSCLAASIWSHCHAKPRSKCAHLQRLLRDAPLLSRGHGRHRAHVVQPVRQLDHNDADLYRQRSKQSRHEKTAVQPTRNGTEENAAMAMHGRLPCAGPTHNPIQAPKQAFSHLFSHGQEKELQVLSLWVRTACCAVCRLHLQRKCGGSKRRSAAGERLLPTAAEGQGAKRAPPAGKQGCSPSWLPRWWPHPGRARPAGKTPWSYCGPRDGAWAACCGSGGARGGPG